MAVAFRADTGRGIEGGGTMKRFILPQRRTEALAYIEATPKEEVLEVEIRPYQKRLPTNLRARVKILVRELAAFNGITYEEFNGIVHRLYYPKRDRVIAGKTIESSIPTNELTPDEARIIEQELYNLGATLGCPLSIPQSK